MRRLQHEDWLFLAFVVSILLVLVSVAWGDESHDVPETLAEAIQHLQPAVSEERADRLAAIFQEAGDEFGINPRLLIAITFKESSFSLAMEQRQEFGESRGEIGLMQCHGACLRFRPDNCTEELVGARCQIMTGTKYLAHARELCGGIMWRWVDAYGYGRCRPDHIGLYSQSVRNARRYYYAIGGTDDAS